MWHPTKDFYSIQSRVTKGVLKKKEIWKQKNSLEVLSNNLSCQILVKEGMANLLHYTLYFLPFLINLFFNLFSLSRWYISIDFIFEVAIEWFLKNGKILILKENQTVIYCIFEKGLNIWMFILFSHCNQEFSSGNKDS